MKGKEGRGEGEGCGADGGAVLGLVVGLPAEAVDLVILLGAPTLLANIPGGGQVSGRRRWRSRVVQMRWVEVGQV